MTQVPQKRFIALDTETTGLHYQDGDRVIEIGAVEVIGNLETGRTYHTYLNPYPRPVHPEAFAVHGISTEQLMDAPRFRDIYHDFFEFIGDAPLVIHNASFDMGFLNEECARLTLKPIQNEIIDSLRIAREKEPGKKASLDHLCLRYGVDNSDRTLHGALVDAAILARVYVKLMGLDTLNFDKLVEETEIETFVTTQNHNRIFRQSRGVVQPTQSELAAHQKFISGIKDSVWGKYSSN